MGGFTEMRIRLDEIIKWQIHDIPGSSLEGISINSINLAFCPINIISDDKWTVGRIATGGKTVTIEAVESTDESYQEPSYIAVDDIIFINNDLCETAPIGAGVGDDSKTSTTQKNGGNIDCADGDGKKYKTFHENTPVLSKRLEWEIDIDP